MRFDLSTYLDKQPRSWWLWSIRYMVGGLVAMVVMVCSPIIAAASLDWESILPQLWQYLKTWAQITWGIWNVAWTTNKWFK